MEYFPAPLEKLVEQFARLPGVGSKSAQRLAFHVLNLPMEQAQAFADAIVDAKRSVTLCPVCRRGDCALSARRPSATRGRSASSPTRATLSPSSAAASITGVTMCCTACSRR